MSDLRKWDIHHSGHCYHIDGLDAYLDRERDTESFRSVIGPYSTGDGSNLDESSDFVLSLMRELVVEIENSLNSREYVMFGNVGSQSDQSHFLTSVMGSDLPFLPNPTLRASLWNDQPISERIDAYAKEWSVSGSESVATHRCGLKFRYIETGNTVRVYGYAVSELGILLAHSLSSDLLLEILAEQGFAYARKFDAGRLFENLVFLPSWFSLDTMEGQFETSVA